MASVALTKQYILEATGKPIGVILPIEEYQALTQAQWANEDQSTQPPRPSLYGILSHLGGDIAPTETIDETRRELWSAQNRS